MRDIDLEAVMNTTNGRAVIYDLLVTSGLYRSSFGDGSSHTMAFNEGMRNLGLMLLSEIKRVCPDQYLLMLKEQNEDG